MSEKRVLYWCSGITLKCLRLSDPSHLHFSVFLDDEALQRPSRSRSDYYSNVQVVYQVV